MTRQPLPKYYVVEPTNICNFRCPMCPNSLYAPEDKGNMPFDLYSNVIEQIRDTAEVVQLYWMGEPLLNADILRMTRLCKEKTQAKVMLSTNGSLLSTRVIEALVSNGLDEIIVSVDACDSQEVYGAIRVGGVIEELNASIRLLIQRKGNMRVVLQFIDMYRNRCEKEDFLKRWQSQDCVIRVSCLYTWANQIPSLSLASDNLSPVAKKSRVPCADLWHKPAIHWDGRVSACCFDWDSRLILGDCKVASLLDIWNGPPVQRLRALHSAGEYSAIPICRQCDAWAEPDEYGELFNLEADRDVNT